MVAARDQHTCPLESELTVDVGQPAFEEVLDLGAEPAGDHSEHARRRLAATELDLVEERSAEVHAAYLGQAQAATLPQPADALAEGFRLRHGAQSRRCKAPLYNSCSAGRMAFGERARRRRLSLRAM